MQLNTSREKAVNMINNKEKDKCTYCRIAAALGKTKSSLTQINVPDNNGGWSMMTNGPEIHNEILDFNQHHLCQANETPFGQHGNLSHHIDPLNSNNQIEHLLTGDASFPEKTPPELDERIDELQQKTQEEISLSISNADFIHCFKGMRESKASSPSGRHVGH